MEIWKQIKDLEGYEVSSLGRVRSKNGIRKLSTKGGNYLRLNVSNNGTVTTLSVHRLVAETFVPNPNNLPEVNHINGDKLDNRAVNLEWTNRRENQTHYNNNAKTRSKYTGVTWNKSSSKWEAAIKVGRKRVYLGLYKTEQEAHKAYLLALEELKLKNRYATGG